MVKPEALISAMDLLHAPVLFVAAALAGMLNSVAGGGSFVSFPALIFTGVLPIPANATSTVALWPGSVAALGAYRKRLPRTVRILVALSLASLVGGMLGAVLLLHTPQATFMHLVSYLCLFRHVSRLHHICFASDIGQPAEGAATSTSSFIRISLTAQCAIQWEGL